MDARFEASEEGRRRWARRRRVYLFSLPAILFFFGPWINSPSFLFRIVVWVGVFVAIPLSLRVTKRRAARSLPPGILLRTVGSLMVAELPESDLSPFSDRYLLPRVRRSGRLEISHDAIRWEAIRGPFAAQSMTVGFEIPLRSVARVEVASFRWPAVYAGLEIFGADGARVAIESRDPGPIRDALAQTTLLSPGREVDGRLAIKWLGEGASPTTPARPDPKPRLDPRVRIVLLVAAALAVAFQITVAPDASSTGLQDAIGAIWLFVGIAALISLLRASPAGPKLLAVAAAAGTIASILDVTAGRRLGTIEVAVWGACTLVALAATKCALSPPTPL